LSSFRPWLRRAEGYWGTGQRKLCMEMPVKPRRPPSLPLMCEVLADHSSFSVLRETPMAFSCDNFKKLNCYRPFDRVDGLLCNLAFLVRRYDEYLHSAITGLYLRDTPGSL
jgi:hypothetical protein